MSNISPKYFVLIAVHSKCQPGKPAPQGEFQRIICAGDAFFQRAKSCGFFFSDWPSKSLVLANKSSMFLLFNSP